MKKAILDLRGVLTGFSDDLTVAGIDVPDDCDLVPGRYFYHAERKAFLPMPRYAAANKLEEQPDTLRAIWKALRNIQRAGLVAFDRETVDWIASYGKTNKE